MLSWKEVGKVTVTTGADTGSCDDELQTVGSRRGRELFIRFQVNAQVIKHSILDFRPKRRIGEEAKRVQQS
jgi:hypothetical protein